ncbi:hypothetical protein COO60DRAFT_648614 [Scenedesmus sp. NREL 46B-D3]|nr:hypothetical protein COO60DRAFT_648614 [Scenedesmus sp. NREL 46B-D3]
MPPLAMIAPNLQAVHVDTIYNLNAGVVACWKSSLSQLCGLQQLQELHISTGGGFSQRWAASTGSSKQSLSGQAGMVVNGLSMCPSAGCYMHSTAPSDGCPQRLQHAVLGCYANLTQLRILNITIPGGRTLKDMKAVTHAELTSANMGECTVCAVHTYPSKALQAYNVPTPLPGDQQLYGTQPTASHVPVLMPAHNSVPPLPAEWSKLRLLQQLHIMPSTLRVAKFARKQFEDVLPKLYSQSMYTGFTAVLRPRGYSATTHRFEEGQPFLNYGQHIEHHAYRAHQGSMDRCERKVGDAVGPLGSAAVGYRSDSGKQGMTEDIAYEGETKFDLNIFSFQANI